MLSSNRPRARSAIRRVDRATSRICLAVAALGWTGSAAAQSSLQLYGLISTGPAHINNVNGVRRERLENSLNFPSYLGFRGTEDLGDGVTASFALATNINVPLGTSGQGPAFWNKNSWVGLGSPRLGAVAVGRNDEFASEQCFTGALCWAGLIFNLHPGNLDHIGGAQLANMIKYISPQFGNYRVRAFVAGGEAGFTNTGRAYGLEGVYRGDQLAVTATWERIEGVTITPASPTVGIGLTRFFGAPATPTTVFNLDRQVISTLGARYTVGPFFLYGLFSDVVLTYKSASQRMRTWESGVTYNVNTLLALTGAGYHTNFATSQWNTFGLTATYQLSKRTSVYLADAYQRVGGPFQTAQMFQSGGPSTTQSQNALAAGVRHLF